MWAEIADRSGRYRAAYKIVFNQKKLQGNENNRIKLPISSRNVAMGCGRGLYARNEGIGFTVVYRCVCVVG